jgi:glycosyltransferase involved in cell wall biosynthesis
VNANGRYLLDARWLGLGGAGRATEFLLRGLREVAPRGWSLWGRESLLREYIWPGAIIADCTFLPTSLAGQRGRVPAADLAVFMHQIRPLGCRNAITLIHDTIPLRFGSSRMKRLVKRAYLKASANRGFGVLTVSEYSATCIERDLGVEPGRIRILHYPTPSGLLQNLVRNVDTEQPIVLYVGRFAAHKRLDMLVQGFSTTASARRGARLVMVGGTSAQLESVAGPARVEFRGTCSDSELVGLYSRAAVVVQPSGEEGFGLPAWEARSAGIPVCAADAGSLPDVLNPIKTFRMDSCAAVAAAIDEVLANPGSYVDRPPLRSEREFASEFLSHIASLAPGRIA